MLIDGDLLLAWMTHVGTGSWAAFRAAVAELVGQADYSGDVAKKMRIVLSELGHADFFVDGGPRWQIRAPALAGLPDAEAATLVGGRTPELVRGLRHTAAAHNVAVTCRAVPPGLQLFTFRAEEGLLRRLAHACDLPYLGELGLRLASGLPRVDALVGAAERRSEPINWEPWSWDFGQGRWVQGRHPNTARRYVNRHGAMRHMLHLRRGGLRSLPPFVAIYAAAAHQRRRIASYEVASSELRVPRRCPLPEAFSRSACMAGGSPSSGDGEHIVYADVPLVLASMILVRLGQPLPPLIPESHGARS